jgi:putative protease
MEPFKTKGGGPMKLTTYLNKLEDISELKKQGVTELILGHRALTRFGELSTFSLNQAIDQCLESNITPVVEWDVLSVESKFEICKQVLSEINLEKVKSIRLQDPGAIHYVKEYFPNLKIQLLLESGAYHNKKAIDAIIKLVGEPLERIVLSLELTKDIVESYIESYQNIDVEFLGLGRILLFYTPRSLVRPLYETDLPETYLVNERPVEVLASSEESPHKGFPVLENIHGTFMFNTKDHFVLEYLPELKKIGLNYLRVDLRFDNRMDNLSDVVTLVDSVDGDFRSDIVEKIKQDSQRPVIRGFFHVNKSDVLFKKLKNYRLLRKDERFIGDIIEVNKGHHLGIFVRSRTNSLSIGDKIKLITPDGKEKTTQIKSMQKSNHQNIDRAHAGEIVFIPHVSGISVKTVVYLN